MPKEWEAECLQWWGRILTGVRAHYCPTWDHLPVDETIIISEAELCSCRRIRRFGIKKKAQRG